MFAGALARKLAEDALRASETMKSAVLASLTSRVAVLDREGCIIAVNESWTRFGRENAACARSVVGRGRELSRRLPEAAATATRRAQEALVGIESVLDGRLPSFAQDYALPEHRPASAGST